MNIANTACAELREARDAVYAELLARQRAEKRELRERQRQGERSPDLIERVRERVVHLSPAANQNAREAAPDRHGEGEGDTAGPTETPERGADARQRDDDHQPAAGVAPVQSLRAGADIVGRVGRGVMGGLATFGERLFDSLFGGPPPRRRTPAPPAIRPVPPPANDAGEAGRRAAESEAEAARHRAVWWEERQRDREIGRD